MHFNQVVGPTDSISDHAMLGDLKLFNISARLEEVMWREKKMFPNLVCVIFGLFVYV